MELTTEQQNFFKKILGRASISFEKFGSMFRSGREKELDEMVDIGLMQREETIEPWGKMVTYFPTEQAKLAVGFIEFKENKILVK
jgi:hypothetical protein